jgi:putative membrane protein
MEAGKKKLSQPVADYAKMLHMEHGMNLEKSLMLGQKLDVTPTETTAVDKLRVKGAGELAMLVPLEGEKFAVAYLAAMIKGHTEVLDMIDSQLLKRAADEAVKAHLTETRGSVAKHLAAAKQLQAGATR